MADDAAAAEAASVTFNVKASNDAKYTFTLPDSTSVLDLKEKLSSSEYADTPADRQRLIYSGRVLKDSETLVSYKIKDGHTIHLVKSAASNQRQNPPTSSSSQCCWHNSQPVDSRCANEHCGGNREQPFGGVDRSAICGLRTAPGGWDVWARRRCK